MIDLKGNGLRIKFMEMGNFIGKMEINLKGNGITIIFMETYITAASSMAKLARFKKIDLSS